MSKREVLITNSEKKFLIKCLNERTRLDGRAFDEFRQLKIQFGEDWGCSYVSLGQTQVLAQVSCEIQEPNSSRPSEGMLIINIELNSIAAQNFEPGRQSDLSVQLNRFLEKCLKDSKAIDLESLCIKMHEKVWALRVDVNVINHEGNILDCASVAALTALAHFKRPDVTCDGEEFIVHSYKERDLLPTVFHHYPICITYAMLNSGEIIIADPTFIEEGITDAYVSIGMNAYKELCALHLGGKAYLSPNVILNIANKATTRATSVIEQMKEAIASDALLRQEKKKMGLKQKISIDKNMTDNLDRCLDQWISQTKIKPFEKQQEISNIKLLNKGFASLIPEEFRGDESFSSGEDVEDDDVVLIDTPKEPTMEISDSDSEEDGIVVLNTDK